MKRLPILLLLTVMVVASLTTGCRDENDPEYWLDQMYDRPWREKSLKTLNEIFNTAMQDNGSDLKNPNVKKLVDLYVPRLIKAFKDFTRDKFNRTEIIKLLAQLKDERAVEIFMIGLDLDESGDSMMFQVSANALRRQAVESALPKLLEAHNTIVGQRSRRPGAPFTNSENEIEQAVISAASHIVVKNPSTASKGKVVKAFCDIAETSDELQELRLNMKALKAIGRIGDAAGIPTLIKGIAMKGKRQPIGLGKIAFAGLQQIHDRDAVIDAVLAFAKGKDAAFNEHYKEELKTDKLMRNPNWYRQEGMSFLGMLNYPSPKAIEFLMAELNHDEPDEVDEAASKIPDLPVNFEPDGWATMRRNWAAVSLAQMGHKPLLNKIKERMTFKKKGRKYTLDLQAEEIVGYVRALGILQYPAESCGMMLKVSKAGDDSLRDKAYYNAALMCGTKFVKPMKKAIKKINCDKIVAQRFPDEGASKEDKKQAMNECDIMKKRIQGYVDRIEYGEKCGGDMACHIKTVKDHTNPNVERAINSLYRIARDDESKREKVVAVLTENLNNPSKVAMQASIHALDHLTPKGGEKLVKRIQAVWKEFSRQSTYKDRARMLESFIGHVRNRGR
ncbi:MAG: hypothetical protein GY854_27045 [Deltaproteobacteria bacterium]|nr:hypothetical protein [Deltaproteobacteria bacterium]